MTAKDTLAVTRKLGKRVRLEAVRDGDEEEPGWVRIPRANMIYRRQALGLSQGDVGVAIGVSQAYVSAVEKGIRVLDLKRLFELAQFLKTTPAALITPQYFVGTTDIDDDLRHTQVRK
jgi:DNA-binding XRE family transcriptional regulator